jgi:hypothetical protein
VQQQLLQQLARQSLVPVAQIVAHAHLDKKLQHHRLLQRLLKLQL